MEPASAPAAMNLREMCARYGITFKKSLGQNLLLDDNINRIMIDAAALSKDDYVVEVGAGLGALTRRIHPEAGMLLSVEIDNSFMPCLEEQFGQVENVRLFRGDFLNHPVEKLVNEFIPGGTSHKFLSNLPYYITTPILFHVLESPLFFSRLVVMMQEEVGQRLVAPVGAENYGILSLAAQCYARVDIVHRVPASCFMPKPKVDSSVVRFRCDTKVDMTREDKLFLMKVVRAAFAQRRKTLRNSLTRSGTFGAPK
ncbi:MAG: 16S rRNA (adenine(1518)-N(6)/adenine(1519)-N(6))-dimethyltransferase RsmA, partial [Gammaproteobacteria bacterium]|nr:16S rRNA (adenine(1518)-N(6)/adenine(1519)-N(6))-dimethyltransferase RsmA [Gammaproteobacteria bacterium]